MYLFGPSMSPVRGRPVELLLAEQALEIDLPPLLFLAVDEGPEAPALDRATAIGVLTSSRSPGMTSTRLSRPATVFGDLEKTRVVDDQGHAQALLVAEDAVTLLLVFAERLAVVADDDDDRILVKPLVPEGLDDLADMGVDEADLPFVEATMDDPSPAARLPVRDIRRMGVVEVDPAEELPPGPPVEPADELRVTRSAGISAV